MNLESRLWVVKKSVWMKKREKTKSIPATDLNSGN